MDRKALDKWFQDGIDKFPRVYMEKDTPWQQSGFSGPEERWVACRKPIADCLDRDGAFLDIGCANGYLMECMLKWTRENGLGIEMYGLDIHKGLVELARQRLPEHAGNLFVGNAFDWQPSRKFHYVRIELVYVPQEYEVQWITRLQNEFLTPDGRLLICEYRSRHRECSEPWIDEYVRRLGFPVVRTESGFWEGKELTRVAVVGKQRLI